MDQLAPDLRRVDAQFPGILNLGSTALDHPHWTVADRWFVLFHRWWYVISVRAACLEKNDLLHPLPAEVRPAAKVA